MAPNKKTTADGGDGKDAGIKTMARVGGELVEKRLLYAIEHPPAAGSTDEDKELRKTQDREKFMALLPSWEENIGNSDPWWGAQQEAALQQEARDDESIKTKMSLFNSHMRSVYKTVFKFTGRLLTDLIGPSSALAYEPEPRGNGSYSWSSAFGDALEIVIVHPFFNSDLDEMALALQWAVICRTDERRRWQLRGCTEGFLLTLQEVIDATQDGTYTAEAMRLVALDVYMEKNPGKFAVPRWAQLLREIEEACCTHNAEQAAEPREEEQEEEYKVSIHDVKNVLAALDNMADNSLGIHLPSATIAATVMNARHSRDAPTLADAKAAMRAALVDERRQAKRVKNGAPKTNTRVRHPVQQHKS